MIIIVITFICHTIIITNNMGKVEKKWQGDLTETMGAYEKLELFKIKKAYQLLPPPPSTECLTNLTQPIWHKESQIFTMFVSVLSTLSSLGLKIS